MTSASQASEKSPADQRVALLLPSLAAGGIARMMLHLAAEFEQSGYQVDLLPCRPYGDYAKHIPPGVRLVKLKPESSLSARLRVARLERGSLVSVARPALLALKPSFTQRYLADLVRYLNEARPDALLSANTPANLLAIWARRLSDVPTRVVVSERTHLSTHSQRSRKWRWRHIVPMVAQVYSGADGIVTVSDGVADDLARIANLPREKITTIYNPVVTDDLLSKANEPAPHPWLDDGGPPVILAAGRLKPQKNFPLLLKTFAQLRARRSARLLIMGEGNQRSELERLVKELELEQDVAMPGFIDNPYAAFSRAAVFVLSSDFEGLPGVLIQALACGCPAVSTDCPSGPREILQDGLYGELVPTNNADALCDALARTLDKPPDKDFLRERCETFASAAVTQKYASALSLSESTWSKPDLATNRV